MFLLCDEFIDALEDHQLPIYVKQAHTTNQQEALACTLEYDSFCSSSRGMVQRETDTTREIL